MNKAITNLESRELTCHIPIMVKVITPEQGAELERLKAEWKEALTRFQAALKNDRALLEGEARARLRAAHEEQVAIFNRIKAIWDQ